MTICVVAADRRKWEFDADDWNSVDTDGQLWVGDRESGEGVAQFARGEWSYVYEVKPAQAVEGDFFIRPGTAWFDEDLAPDTEVIS